VPLFLVMGAWPRADWLHKATNQETNRNSLCAVIAGRNFAFHSGS